MKVVTAVSRALEAAPDDDRAQPAREVAMLLAEDLDKPCSPNERAALARELRQTLASLLSLGSDVDRWAQLMADLGDAE